MTKHYKAIISGVLVAFVLAIGVAGSASASNEQQFSQNHYVTWQVPAGVDPTAVINTPQFHTAFPQTLVGVGNDFDPPCEVWYQVDKYEGSKQASKDIREDGVLSWVSERHGPGHPEDNYLYISHKFVNGGPCQTQPPSTPPSEEPTQPPSSEPSESPTATPTDTPSESPTVTSTPTTEPTNTPTTEPSTFPTPSSTPDPSETPTVTLPPTDSSSDGSGGTPSSVELLAIAVIAFLTGFVVMTFATSAGRRR